MASRQLGSDKEGATPSNLVSQSTISSYDHVPIVPAILAVPLPEVALPEVDVVDVQVDADETAEVVAPATLQAGYHFTVEVGSRSLLVEVPPGGVTEGEIFRATVVSGTAEIQQRSAERIPLGDWRDGIFDCLKFGICQPMCWLTLCVWTCSLGQIMTRLRLNACGEPEKNKSPKCSAFAVIVILSCVCSFFTSFIGQGLTELSIFEDDDGGGDPGWSMAITLTRVAVLFFWTLFSIIIGVRTRYYIRKKYKIKSKYGGPCEDFCCMLWCPYCAVCQMARHTVDYDQHESRCCTKTGLRPGDSFVV
jgi:Cys-rich protein (TIGR01571 family)